MYRAAINRERKAFVLLVQDKTTRNIARQLFIGEKTFRNHISNVICFETHPAFLLCLIVTMRF
ncbi:LuxR C-terminal-related transcriptional regulator [Cohnella sp. GCM10012308]|uniref:LuxR C-terminal-related transcriptional regulator n=1 Tax=Cohnella sp. GCM10012308 TaxID=3317329 RepID=UPI00361128CA